MSPRSNATMTRAGRQTVLVKPSRVGYIAADRQDVCAFCGHGEVAEWLKAPHSKFGDTRPDPFRSIPTSVELYCENRRHVPLRPVQYRPGRTRVRPCRRLKRYA